MENSVNFNECAYKFPNPFLIDVKEITLNIKQYKRGALSIFTSCFHNAHKNNQDFTQYVQIYISKRNDQN